MPRQYKTSYQSTRNLKRFQVQLPVSLGDAQNPNSRYWQDKLADNMEIIKNHPEMLAVWDSSLVPDHATYREHAELAIKIVNGELKLKKDYDFTPAPDMPDIDMDKIQEIPF